MGECPSYLSCSYESHLNGARALATPYIFKNEYCLYVTGTRHSGTNPISIRPLYRAEMQEEGGGALRRRFLIPAVRYLLL
jgi:hypothetical protein